MALLPKVKLKSVVSFPSTAVGRTGIDVDKENGNFYIDLAFGDFAPPVSGLIDPANLNALLWNQITGVYVLTPVSLLGGGGGVPEAPTDNTLYGRQNAAWVAVPSGGGGGGGGNTVVVTASGPVTVGSGDAVVAIKKTTPAATVANLPLGANKTGPVHIVDAAMNAGTFNITITPTSPETIMGLPNWTIAGDGGGLTLYPIPGVGYVI